MKITSFNINKFCGPYSNGKYYNPRNIDYKTQIKKYIDNLLSTENDIVFLQEFLNNRYINVEKLFPEDKYSIKSNEKLISKIKSMVVAITLKDSKWSIIRPQDEEFTNKYIEMEYKDEKMNIHAISFQNTNEVIKNKVNKHFEKNDVDIFIGDFNNTEWINVLHKNKNYRDLVTDDMITFKPSQKAIDRIFIKKSNDFNGRIVFNGIDETYLSDHNLLTFALNVD